MNRRVPNECSKTAAVLAIHLDGDIATACAEDAGFAFASGPTLAEHLRDCAICQRQLQRARRLDAALAAQSGQRMATLGHDLAPRAARWFAQLDEAATTTAPQRTSRRGPVVIALGLVALAAMWFAARWPATLHANDAGASPSHPTVSPVVAPAVSPAETYAAEAPLPTPAAGPRQPDLVIAHDSARRLASKPRTVTAHAPSAVDLLQRFASPALPPPSRLASLQAARLAVRSAAAERTVAAQALRLLASLPEHTAADHQLHSAALAELRRWPLAGEVLVEQLTHLDEAAPLDGAAAIVLAARWQTRDVDSTLLRALRQRPPLVDVVAAALRSGLRGDGAGRLLLDAWDDLANRGLVTTDAGPIARRLFAGQAGPVFDELLTELRASRAAQRRVCCLLAMGHCPDDRVLPTLLEVVDGSHRGEAMAAAYALAHLPHALLQPLVERAANARDGLLRAALACAGLDAAQPWLRALPLTPAERARLVDATWTDFPLFVSWLCPRPRATGS